jgi:hypothetical protein
MAIPTTLLLCKESGPKVLFARFLEQDAHNNFFTPLSIEAFQQLVDLMIKVQALPTPGLPNNFWTYIWGLICLLFEQGILCLQGYSAILAHFQMDVEVLRTEASTSSTPQRSS